MVDASTQNHIAQGVHPDRIIHKPGPQRVVKDRVRSQSLITLRPGQLLFTEGQDSDAAYFLKSGTLEIRVRQTGGDNAKSKAGSTCQDVFANPDEDDEGFRFSAEIADPAAKAYGTVVALVGAGEIVGEMGAINGDPRCATARAMTECVVQKMPISALKTLVSRSDPGMRALLDTLISRLKATNQQVAVSPTKPTK